MLKNKKVLALISFAIVAAFLFTACAKPQGGPSNTNTSDSDTHSNVQRQIISIAAASPGGTLYILGSTISKILNDKLGLEASVESTGGALSNQQLLDSNQSMFGIITTDISYDAWNGLADWTSGKPMRNVRTVLPLYVLQMQAIARKDANISRLSDMNGKVIAAGPAGSAHDQLTRKIFEMFNIKPSKILNLTLGDTVDQMQNRKIDALMVVSSAPNSTLTNISTTMESNIIPFSEEEVRKMCEELPYMKPYTIPAGTYKGQDEDCSTVTQWGFLAVNKDQPDELVYEITKVLVENWDVMESAVTSTKGVIPQNVEDLNLPLHSGAAKYLEEISVNIPDHLQPLAN